MISTLVGVYITIDGVTRDGKLMPIVPEVSLRDASRHGMRLYTQKNPYQELSSRDMYTSSYRLLEGRADRWVAMAREQAYVKAGIVPEEDMREFIGNITEEIWGDHGFYLVGEVIDTKPQERGLNLPKGTDALVYRNDADWTANEDGTIDVSRLDPEKDIVAVKIPRVKIGPIVNFQKDFVYLDRQWEELIGADKKVRHYPLNLERSRLIQLGLNVVRLRFRSPEPYISSLSGYYDGGYFGGTLLGSRRDMEELVESSSESRPALR